MAKEYSSVELEEKATAVETQNKRRLSKSPREGRELDLRNLSFEEKKANSSALKRAESKSIWSVSVFRSNDFWKIYWDALILVIAVFNSIFIPITLSFGEIKEYLNNQQWYKIVDYTSIVLFISDIFIMMNTTYYDSDGEEIFSKKKIR